MKKWVILVLCGWINENWLPSKQTILRLKKAIKLYNWKQFIITMWRGTLYKAQFIDKRWYTMDEATIAADYLYQHWIPSKDIKIERFSFDTLWSIYFTKIFYLDVLEPKTISVITSKFHIERTKIIFKWLYMLCNKKINIKYIKTNDCLDDKTLQNRITKEKDWIRNISNLMKKIKNRKELTEWLFKDHAAYAYKKRIFKIDKETINSY